MKYLIFGMVSTILLMNNFSLSQLVWSGYTSSPYNTGTAPNNMEVNVTSNQLTFGDGTPKYSTSTSPQCYIATGSLALYTQFNSYKVGVNSNITVTMRFNKGYSGTCNRVSFKIKGLNSDESNTTFCDVVEISAVDGANSAVAAASIVTALPSNVTRVVSGTTVKLVGHSNAAETVGSYSSTDCQETTVTITPPANEELKTVTIKYRPAYGTSISNAYYTSGDKPAFQYISIGAVTLTSNGSCTILPVKLTSFNASREDRKVELNWQTASEQNNDYFTIEKSTDGVNTEEIAKIPGAGNSSTLLKYHFIDPFPSTEISYYRLKQTDFNGESEYFDWISVKEEQSDDVFFVKQIEPNPSHGTFNIYSFAKKPVEVLIRLMDQTGRILYVQSEYLSTGSSITSHTIDLLNSGIYFLRIDVEAENYSSVNRIIID